MGQSISPPVSQLTAIIGGNETGELNVEKGSTVISGTAGGPVNTEQSGAGATQSIDGGASTLPFNFTSVESDLTNCSENYATTANGTVMGVGYSSPYTQVLGFQGTAMVNVFNVTADQLAVAQKLLFGVPAGSTNLIDVLASADHPSSLDLSGINAGIYYGCPTSPAISPSGWGDGNCGSQPDVGANTSTIDHEHDNTVWNFSRASTPRTTRSRSATGRGPSSPPMPQ